MSYVQIADLKSRGFTTFSSLAPNLSALIVKAMMSWQKFCALEHAIKGRFVYNTDKYDGAGYELKIQQGRNLDLKENFHFTIAELFRLVQVAKGISDHDTFNDLKTLFTVSYNLIAEIEYLVFLMGYLLEQELSLSDLAFETILGRENWILRYLHYFPAQSIGEVIAKPHPDKAGLTFYLGETTPGVQYLNWERQWINMPNISQQISVTPNLQLQYRSEGLLKALYHQVVANQEAATSGRYSMVLFVPFVRTPVFNTAGKGSQQDLPLGWNYDMPFEEFSKLFI